VGELRIARCFAQSTPAGDTVVTMTGVGPIGSDRRQTGLVTVTIEPKRLAQSGHAAIRQLITSSARAGNIGGAESRKT
jgi:hypothetical protein